MSRAQRWTAAAVVVGYGAFVIIFREQAEMALSSILHFIGAVL